MNHHEAEIVHLKDRLLTMAGFAESAVVSALKALANRDDQAAARVKSDDRHIDELEKEIDALSIRLLTMAPLATELRMVVVAMKISRDLERIGDEATTISRRVLELNAQPPFKPSIDVGQMARLALDMLRAAIETFVRQDPAGARRIVPRDKEVDTLNRQLQRELTTYMVDEPDMIGRCLSLMAISKAIERIGDHAKNIAEDVVFLCEGSDIRHSLGPTNE